MSIQQIKNSSNIKKTTVVIDYNYAQSGTPVDFIYQIPTEIQDIRLVEVTNVDFTNDSYNVNVYNNSINFTDSLSVNHTIFIPEGNYYIDSLLEAVQEQLNIANTDGSVIYTVSLNVNDRVAITTYRGIESFTLDWTSSTTLRDVLGFLPEVQTGSTIYVGAKTPDLIYSKKLYIESTTLSITDRFDMYDTSIGTTSVIKDVSINSNYGSIISDVIPSNFRTSKDSIELIDIFLRDDFGRPFLLSNDNFKLTMDIYSRVFSGGFSI